MREGNLGGVRAEQPITERERRRSQPEEYGEQCGGDGGVPYRVFARPPTQIRKVTVWHRQYIDGIQLATADAVLPKIGGTGRHRDVRVDCFELEPGEFLTGISVEYWNLLDRITFHSNLRSYGPYGGSGGQVRKELSVPPGRAVAGFTGRHWDFVDSNQLMITPEA